MGDFVKLKLRQDVAEKDIADDINTNRKPHPLLQLRGTQTEQLRKQRHQLDHSVPATPAVIPNTIKPFIDLWFEAGGIKHGECSLTLKQGIKGFKQLRRGVFFKETEFETNNGRLELYQWEQIMGNYKKALSLEYQPIQKGMLKVSLPDFMYNPFAKSVQTKSWLLYFFENEPKTKTPERFPSMTKALVKAYGKEYLNHTGYEPNPSEMDRFILGANRLGMFFVKNQRKMSPHMRFTDYKKAQLLVRAVKKGAGRNTVVTPGFLCSNITFQIRLPTYLKEQAIFSSVDRARFR